MKNRRNVFAALWSAGAPLLLSQCHTPLPEALSPLASRSDKVEAKLPKPDLYGPIIPLLRDASVVVNDFDLRLRPLGTQPDVEEYELSLFECGRLTLVLTCHFRKDVVATGGTSSSWQSALCELGHYRGVLSVDVIDFRSSTFSSRVADIHSNLPGKLCFAHKSDHFFLRQMSDGDSPAVASVYECPENTKSDTSIPRVLLAAAVVKDQQLTLLVPHEQPRRGLLTTSLLLALALEP